LTVGPQARLRSLPPGGAVRQRPGEAGSAAGSSIVSARSFLAFDYGTRRIGVASGNALLGQGQARCTVNVVGARHFDAIAQLIAEWQPAALVVGVPFHPDGAAHENTLKARRFARQLHGRFKLPVHEVDERYTTTEALASGAADADADAESAAIILTQFFNQLHDAPTHAAA